MQNQSRMSAPPRFSSVVDHPNFRRLPFLHSACIELFGPSEVDQVCSMPLVFVAGDQGDQSYCKCSSAKCLLSRVTWSACSSAKHMITTAHACWSCCPPPLPGPRPITSAHQLTCPRVPAPQEGERQRRARAEWLAKQSASLVGPTSTAAGAAVAPPNRAGSAPANGGSHDDMPDLSVPLGDAPTRATTQPWQPSAPCQPAVHAGSPSPLAVPGRLSVQAAAAPSAGGGKGPSNGKQPRVRRPASKLKPAPRPSATRSGAARGTHPGAEKAAAMHSGSRTRQGLRPQQECENPTPGPAAGIAAVPAAGKDVFDADAWEAENAGLIAAADAAMESD